MDELAPVTDTQTVERHNISPEEYDRIKSILGRAPNLVELGVFSVMWSEHCSYKSSRKHLRLFPTQGPQVIQGPGENAGVVDIGDGDVVVFKMESHNHPSYIEPYQGAATGVGGILRDIFTMGARPVASLDSLRFGAVTHHKTRYLLDGVVSGVAGYGNCMGVPTVGGELVFDRCYNSNCLVNVFNLGLARGDAIFKGKAEGEGNPIMYVGAKTGRDGIHGATMASEEFDETSEQRRPTVQVGDPFTEKRLLEACLELFKTDYVVGIQDMGAAGLTSSSMEMASRAGTGIEMDLARVPRREKGMTAYEIMLSESQERMLLVARKGTEENVAAIFHKWGLNADVVGRVTSDGMARIYDGGAVVANIPAAPLSDQAPVYDRPAAPPADLAARHELDLDELHLPVDLTATLLEMIGSPNMCSKEWVWRQYDHQVRTNTVQKPGSDAAVIRLKGTTKAVAMSVDCNARYCWLDPYEGGKQAVAEAARNVACSGATPLAVTDCLNFGSPERPDVMWSFIRAIEGMSDACRALNTPVVSGNVSFYNQTGDDPIRPTPTVGAVGLLREVDKLVGQFFRNEGDLIILIGETFPEIGGSEYLSVIYGIERGLPPKTNLTAEAALIKTLIRLADERVVSSMHDLSDGGLAVALAECALLPSGGGLGFHVKVNTGLRPDVALFSESQGRALISCPPDKLERIVEIVADAGLPGEVIGRVTTGEASITINDAPTVSTTVAAMYSRWSGALPKLMGGGAVGH